MHYKAKALFIGCIAIAIAGLIGLALSARSVPTGVPVEKSTAATKEGPVEKRAPDASTFVRFNSPAFGNRSSKVLVVEWFDPECEGCRAIHPAFEKIVFDYSDRVHFVLRYMPFHKNSLYAAAVLEEARQLEKFKEALNVLFQKQLRMGQSRRAPARVDSNLPGENRHTEGEARADLRHSETRG